MPSRLTSSVAFLRTGVFKFERALTDDMGFPAWFLLYGLLPRGYGCPVVRISVSRPEFRVLPFRAEAGSGHGTYLAPNFRYMKLSAEDETSGDKATLTTYGFAINLGHQVVFKDIIVVDGWIGPVYAFRNVSDQVGMWTWVSPQPMDLGSGWGLPSGSFLG
jgi:hypothetical protein